MAEENKDKVVSFRMSEGEYERVAKNAESEGRSVSEHIRRKVLREDPNYIFSPSSETYSTTANYNVTYYNLP